MLRSCFLIFSLIILLNPISKLYAQNHSAINIIYLSDVHFGLKKENFRGKKKVSSGVVNQAIIEELNNFHGQRLPNDKGVAANTLVGNIASLIITGDIANREEKGVLSASVSWQQFASLYFDGLHLKNDIGEQTPIFLTPGNHDASNAIGYFKPLQPAIDNKSMVEIYNRMLHPKEVKTIANFNYQKDVPNYSIDLQGVHLIFPSIWPDSANRIWMENDLSYVSDTTPVLLFTHVPPYGDAKLFTNPNNPPTINPKDKFENLLREHYKDALRLPKHPKDTLEEIGLDSFLYAHPNIKAYFHGHENHNEFYMYRGVKGNLALPTFRVDSPMKGKISSKDETKLSFQLISIDMGNHLMTVRECFYNSNPSHVHQKITWGDSKTVSLK